MSNDFQTRMRRQGIQKIPAEQTSAAPADADVLFAETGAVTQRPMTDAERQAISQGQLPTSNLSEAEKRQLLKLGWTEGLPVPPDIQEMFQKVVADGQPKPTVPGHIPKEMQVVDIADLPPQEQERVRQAMKEAITASAANAPKAASSSVFSAYPPDIAAAMQAATNPEMLKEVEIPDWNSQPSSVSSPQPQTSTAVPNHTTSPAAQQSSDEPSQLPTVWNQKRCVHCGGDPFEDLSKQPIALEDKQAFLISIGTGRSFEKEYSIFNATITARFRSLRAGEADIIGKWANEKAQEEVKYRRMDMEMFLGMVRRYEAIAALALQTTYLKSNLANSTLYWAAPEGNNPGLKDWTDTYQIQTIDDLVDNFNKVIGNDAVATALRERLGQFNSLDYRMMVNANDTENFWQGI